jgi:hypothetical protein
MGKQVNYEMSYDSFLQLAQFALDAGCMIIRNNHSEEKQIPCKDISAVTTDCQNYYFYIPELYPIHEIQHKKDSNGKYYVADTMFGPFSLALIEASYSTEVGKQARVYVTTGYYDKSEMWFERPDLLTKTYDRIARKAKKLAQRIL